MLAEWTGAKLPLRLTLLLLPVLLTSALMPPAAAQPALLLQKTWGGSWYSSANGLAVDSSGNIYTIGRMDSVAGSPSYAMTNITLLKYNSTGSLLWQRIWSGGSNVWSIGFSVAVDASGNAYVTGRAQSDNARWEDILLLKFNSTGALLWQRTWGDNEGEYGSGVAADSLGNIYATGTASIVSHSGILLLKLNATGSIVWQRTWLGLLGDSPGSVAVDSSGDIYVTTESTGASTWAPNLLKFDSSGNLLWQRTWEGSAQFFAYYYTFYSSGVAVDASGNVYAVGVVGCCETLFDAFLLKLSSAGSLLWGRTWGGSNFDSASSVAVNSSGVVFVTGFTASSGAGGNCARLPGELDCTDVFLLKFNSAGGLLFQETWGGAGYDYGNGIAVDSLGNAVVAGSVNESSPYLLTSPNGTLGVPRLSLSAANGTVDTPNVSLGTPTGTAQTVSGTESYTGGTNQFLIGFDASTTTPLNPTPLTPALALIAASIAIFIPLIKPRMRHHLPGGLDGC